MTVNSFVRFALCLFFFAGVAGCGGSSGIRHVFSGHYVKITPSKVTVPVGQGQFFQAESVGENVESFLWEVKEGDDGGTLYVRERTSYMTTSGNTYTAPQKAGTYHVKVTGTYQNGTMESATATVEVKYDVR